MACDREPAGDFKVSMEVRRQILIWDAISSPPPPASSSFSNFSSSPPPTLSSSFSFFFFFFSSSSSFLERYGSDCSPLVPIM
jgi:hypothetical protein